MPIHGPLYIVTDDVVHPVCRDEEDLRSLEDSPRAGLGECTPDLKHSGSKVHVLPTEPQ